ncbi:unnamed protein product, partial [Didymodactylos carnosus]
MGRLDESADDTVFRTPHEALKFIDIRGATGTGMNYNADGYTGI